MSASRKHDPRLREAADWFAKLNARAVSVVDLEAFRVWAAAPANRKAYEAVEKVWKAAGALAGDPAIARQARSVAARKPRRFLRWLAPGAVLGAAAVGAGLIWIDGRPETFSTVPGERRSVRLDDGSRIQLDTDTTVQARLGPDRRRLRLVRGQALFDVAHDRSRPFQVEAGSAVVTATGTRFDVRADNGRVEVVLVEGGVTVEDGPTGRWRLTPGQRIVTGTSARAVVVPVDVGQVLSWTEGRLVFAETPLADAVRDINRYGDRPVRIGSGVDSSTLISGAFDAGDSAAFAEAVAILHGLKVQRGREDIRLTRPVA